MAPRGFHLFWPDLAVSFFLWCMVLSWILYVLPVVLAGDESIDDILFCASVVREQVKEAGAWYV
jgi:hypothetical protein